MQDEYNYDSYVNAKNDSDLAEEEVFTALENHEKTNIQKVSPKPKASKKQNLKIDPFKGTSLEGQVSSPFRQAQNQEPEENEDGTLKYSKEQQ